MLFAVHGHPDLLFLMILNWNDIKLILKKLLDKKGGKIINKIKWNDFKLKH